MSMNYLVIILPLICAGFEHDGITINIEPAETEANVTIKYSGEDIKVVTDSDLAAFDLTNDKIHEAVKVFSGEKATDVFTRSPTPWGDLYKTYKWSEVKRQFKIKNIKRVNVTIEEKIVGSIKEYTNNDTEIKEIKGHINNYYDDFLSEHYWSGNEKVSASVKYELLRPYWPNPLKHGFLSEVGGVNNGIVVITTANIGATFKLQPGQKANIYLKANAVITRVNVEYETKLAGHFAVNYEKKYEGHHFWAYDVNEVLAASNLPTTVVSNEYVEIQYFKDFETEVVDAATGVDIKFTV